MKELSPTFGFEVTNNYIKRVYKRDGREIIVNADRFNNILICDEYIVFYSDETKLCCVFDIEYGILVTVGKHVRTEGTTIYTDNFVATPRGITGGLDYVSVRQVE